GVEVSSTAFCREAGRCSPAKASRASPCCAARAPAATAIRGNPRAGMRAITVSPGTAHSARLEEVPEPPETDGAGLVRAWALGVGGTDPEILDGRYGFGPPGQQRLILGHESLGAVEAAPEGCGLAPGDLVVGVVRRPDPVPCLACAAGEWDMCRNSRSGTATAPNASASSRTSRSGSTRH